jgi:hypothetical protein
MAQRGDRLFLAKGTLTVEARGYWFTAGGEKGPFGFYPHLKDADGRPVFPDTQVHGDLLMAARWLSGVDGGIDKSRVEQVFGRPGANGKALLRVSDLELTEDHKTGKTPDSFFQTKPRIRIREDAGTVERHMLVEREHAWLDGRVLRAEIWMGYFTDEEEMAACKTLVAEAAGFLGGFGGSRSRGLGRGTATVEWGDDEVVAPTGPVEPEVPATFGYFLTALTHFRNKPVERGSTQVVGGMTCVRADQLRGWFVRAFRDVYGQWPEPGQMASLRFPALYPSDGQTDRPGFPPPMSTLRNENGEVRDLWGASPAPDDTFNNDEENFFRTKTKPLPGGNFVTADGPRAAILPTTLVEQRFRNAMDATFTTIDDGLFVQELIGRGTCFGGVFRLTDPTSDFAAKAFRLLSRVRPDVKGTLFESRVVPSVAVPQTPAPDKPVLVIDPIRLETGRTPDDGDQISVGVEKRFNAMLGRPRRNRLVISPGSVLRRPDTVDAVIAWPGFGGPIDAPAPEKPEKETPPVEAKEPSLTTEKPEWVITRSQAGLLRDYLHPGRSESEIRKNLKDRIEKYQAKSEEKLAGLLAAVLDRLDKEGADAMRTFVRGYLENLAVYLWEKKGEEDR